MEADERQFLLTTAWLFAQHGQGPRARVLCEALVEDNPKDGVSAIALAELLLAEGRAQDALSALQATSCPAGLERAEALLETRALVALGRRQDADRRWKRYVAASKGGKRTWVAG